ncbi:MAG TPA: DUF4870 domain-containing protein [Candidatus Baltobacteraceae bacterium]|nr:DUF4870 domain-containing protein [Candidatus Baltobacteraceae bacterium]
MDCFFHHAVPSVAACRGCRKPICATCRSAEGDCPSCVLAARLDAAARERTMIHGGVGPSYGSYAPPPPPPPQPEPAPPPRVQRTAAVCDVRPETRAVVALSYPFWPLALIALLDSKGSVFVKRQAWQALGFNIGLFTFGGFLTALASIPLLGISAAVLVPFLAPIWAVAAVIYAVKVWQGDDVHVPIVGDWIDARLPAPR